MEENNNNSNNKNKKKKPSLQKQALGGSLEVFLLAQM